MLQEIPLVPQNATALIEQWEAQKCWVLVFSIGKRASLTSEPTGLSISLVKRFSSKQNLNKWSLKQGSEHRNPTSTLSYMLLFWQPHNTVIVESITISGLGILLRKTGWKWPLAVFSPATLSRITANNTSATALSSHSEIFQGRRFHPLPVQPVPKLSSLPREIRNLLISGLSSQAGYGNWPLLYYL